MVDEPLHLPLPAIGCRHCRHPEALLYCGGDLFWCSSCGALEAPESPPRKPTDTERLRLARRRSDERGIDPRASFAKALDGVWRVREALLELREHGSDSSDENVQIDALAAALAARLLELETSVVSRTLEGA